MPHRFAALPMTQAPGSAIAYAATGAVLFSAKAVVVKLCYRHGAHTETVLALRMLFAMPFFWAAVWWQGVYRRPQPMQRKDVVRALLLGFVGYYLSSYLDFLGLQYVSAGLAAQSGVVGPVATVFLGWYFLGEPVGLLQFVGVAVVLASVGMLLAPARKE